MKAIEEMTQEQPAPSPGDAPSERFILEPLTPIHLRRRK
jgi:hypothetical protein